MPKVISGQCFVTEEGGLAVFLEGNNLARGELVFPGNSNGQVLRTIAATAATLYGVAGVVYATTPIGGRVPVVITGMAWVLPETTATPVAGDLLLASPNQNGRAQAAVAIPPVSDKDHFTECGHVSVGSAVQGGLCLAQLHFN